MFLWTMHGLCSAQCIIQTVLNWEQTSQLGIVLYPQVHLAIYGDVFDCHIEGGANSISRVEARDAAIHKTGPYNKASSPKCQRCPSLETLIWMIRVYGTIVS